MMPDLPERPDCAEIRVAADNPLAPILIDTCRNRRIGFLELPDRQQMVVLPRENFDALQRIFREPEFLASLEAAVADFESASGRVVDESPAEAARRAWQDRSLVDDLERACEDYRLGRGRVRNDDGSAC